MALPADSNRDARDIRIDTPATDDRCSREFDHLQDDIIFSNLPPDDIKPNAAFDLLNDGDADMDAVGGPAWNQGPSEDLSGCAWDAGPDFAYWPLHLSSLVNQQGRQEVFEPMAYTASGPATAAELDGQGSESSQETARQESPHAEILLQQSKDDFHPVYPAVFDATGEPFWFVRDRVCDSPAPSQSYSPSSTPRASSPEYRFDHTQQATGTTQPRSHPGRQPSLAKEWPCKTCNKLFSDRKSLSQHSRYHTKRYACPSCGGQFGTNRDRKRHQETHGHGEAAKLQACEEEGCKFRFKACRKDIYRRHCKLIHKKYF